jgi:hypothetical protein
MLTRFRLVSVAAAELTVDCVLTAKAPATVPAPGQVAGGRYNGTRSDIFASKKREGYFGGAPSVTSRTISRARDSLVAET